MTELHITLIDELESASATLSRALDVVADKYGCGDELFDELATARDTAAKAARRLQNDADTYGEMVYNGV